MTPKEKIQKSPRLKEIASLLNSPLLEECCEAAMLTFIDQHIPPSADHMNAAAHHYRLDGAKIFLRTLRGLASLTPERKPDMTGQLNHGV